MCARVGARRLCGRRCTRRCGGRARVRTTVESYRAISFASLRKQAVCVSVGVHACLRLCKCASSLSLSRVKHAMGS